LTGGDDMATDFPCFKLLYLIPGKERAIKYFLNMSKSTRLNLNEVESLFKSITYFHSIFNLNSLTEEQIKKYYLDAPYAKCADLKEDILRELGSMKINPCKICEYSSSYQNDEKIKEMRIFYYLLSHPNDVENWKLISPKKHFKSQFIYLTSDNNMPNIFQIPLFEKMYSLLLNYITSSPDVVAYENITDIIYPVKMRFFSTHLKDLRDCSDQMFQIIMTQLRDDYIKCDIPDTEQFLELLQSFPKRRSYTAKSFLPEAFKNLKFDEPQNQISIPNFLGSIVPDSITPREKSCPKSLAPMQKTHEISSLEELRALAVQDNKPLEKPPVESIPPIVETDNSKTLKVQESTSLFSINKATNDLEDKSFTDCSEQEHSSLFDENGRFNLSKEIESCCVLYLHPHDIYSMLQLIGKEEWIGIERATDGNKDGIFIYLGSGHAAYFLDLEILDSEIIKCLFFYEHLSVISMNGCGIFHFLLLQGVHAYPKITSLTSKYNAVFKTDLLYPAAELMDLIKDSSTKFIYSPAIELVQNYNTMNLIIGKKSEENNCHKSEEDYLFYEFALGSSMNISKITGLKLCNLKRNTFFNNIFLFDGLFIKEGDGVVCNFNFSFKKNNGIVPINLLNKIMVFVISHIFKNRNLWKFKPILLSYDTEHLAIYVHTNSRELISIVEENVCMHLAKQGKFFGMDAPHIIINT
jgi:hypothetical protein